MSAEKEEAYSEETPSPIDFEISQTLRAIAAAKELAVLKNHSETTLETLLTGALNNELREVRKETAIDSSKTPTTEKPELTYGERNRANTRRHSRREANQLMTRRRLG